MQSLASNFFKKLQYYCKPIARHLLPPSPDKAPAPESGEILLSRAIVIRVNEGLANQMICYKAARMLAKLNSATLILDTTAYESIKNNGRRNYQLHHHAIRPDLTIFSAAVMQQIREGAGHFQRIERKDLPGGYATEVPENLLLGDNDRILDLGFWAALHLRSLADRFFEENNLLDEIRLRSLDELKQNDLDLLREIESCEHPTAIHVRRGDYATHDGGLLLPREYYIRAICRIEETHPDTEFFVFSDEPGWCKENLKSASPMYFADWNNDQTGYRDLYLASRCRHFILSNESTFSHQIVQLSGRPKGSIVITSSMSDIVRHKLPSTKEPDDVMDT